MYGQQVGISTNAAAPNANAILDINAASLPAAEKRGMLIPRMTEAQRLAMDPGLTHLDHGLLVYQTDFGTDQDTTSAGGFWYWVQPNASPPGEWAHLSAARTAWSITGNTIGNPFAAPPRFLGMVDASANRNLVFRTGADLTANPAMQMGYGLLHYQAGHVGLGTAAPATERLEVEGAVRLPENGTVQLSPPREGTIRYGTVDGLNRTATNPAWYWGALNEMGTKRWARLDNAETLVTPPQSYLKDTVKCQNEFGDAVVGRLSPEPVTMPVANDPANYWSPFATNFITTGAGGSYRVEYLYRNEELVEAGLCFPATIRSFSFYVLDQEALIANADHPLHLDGEVRGGAPTIGGLQGPGAYFGVSTKNAAGIVNSAPPRMDNGIRTAPVNGTFQNLTPGPGWLTFNLTTPITLAAGDNLILDVVWSRSWGNNGNSATYGVGPRVELMDPGFTCTRWAMITSSPPGFAGGLGGRNATYDHNASAPSGYFNGATGTTAPTTHNGHSKRPVTRFNAKVATPFQKEDHANYLQYDGGVMVGSPAWVSGTQFAGPGTVKAENGVFDGTTMLSDHVFDRYFDGQVLPEDAAAAEHYRYVGLPQLRESLERDRHLPNMPSRAQWEAGGGASLGQVATGLWETVEDQALYISELEKDLSILEQSAFGERLDPERAEHLIGQVNRSRRLTSAQKMHLTEAIRAKTQQTSEQR